LTGTSFRSADNGISWNGVGPGIPADAGGFAIKAIDNNVFIGNSAGIFFSSDQGASFTDVSDGMDPDPNDAVQGITANNQYVFAGTFRDAVWKRPLSDFGIIGTTVSEVNKAELVLYQNSPNPFSQRTMISYTLPEGSNVFLSITDVAGKVVFESSKNSETAGFHSITFDGAKLSSGIYFVKLNADEEVRVMKMVVER